MPQLNDQIQSILYRVRYLLTARHRKGHGIHSPAVFEFVSRVVADRTHFPDYDFFRSKKQMLAGRKEMLDVLDMGAPSRYFHTTKRKISDLHRIAAIDEKSGRLLYRMVRFYGPSKVIELGTSLGLSTMYMARAHTGTEIISVEGNASLSKFAANWLGENNLNNVRTICATFSDALESLEQDIRDARLVFIDGDHRYEATLHYVNYFRKRMRNGFIVIDDICWSKAMMRAWRDIVSEAKECVTIDLCRMGIILVKESVTAGHFTVRY